MNILRVPNCSLKTIFIIDLYENFTLHEKSASPETDMELIQFGKNTGSLKSLQLVQK